MYEKLEQDRIQLQRDQMKYERERQEKEYRFRCLEFARNGNSDNATILQDAQKFLAFVEGK